MPAAAAGEIDEVAAVGREIGTAFVDAAAQPLTEFELVCFAVPPDRADGVGRAAPEDQAHRRLGSEQNVQPGRKSASHFSTLVDTAADGCHPSVGLAQQYVNGAKVCT